MNIKKGDVLKGKHSGFPYKVLGIVDGVYIMSAAIEYRYGGNFFTLEGLKETFELPEEKWVPEVGRYYFYISIGGRPVVCSSDWLDHPVDNQRYESGNCFKDIGTAEAKLAEILAVLKK